MVVQEDGRRYEKGDVVVSQDGPKEDDAFYIRRALNRAEDFEYNSDKHDSDLQAKLAN
jgi:hypothetical protein